MKSLILSIFIVILTACSSGRIPIPPGEIPLAKELTKEEIAFGTEVYNGLSSQFQADTDLANGRKVRAIVNRLAEAAGGPYGAEPWQVTVFKDDETINAAATRGNYIFVWTGIIKNSSSDSELATVLAHEVSHVLADHTTPTAGEMTNKIISGSVGGAAEIALASNGYYGAAQLTGELASILLTALITNPESQRVESEADTIGLFLMAKAGYDPKSAIKFWQKMIDLEGGGSSFAFLSSHPPSEKRLEILKMHLPDAESLYFKYNKSKKEW